ncbi:GGDEF domain-containing protein [Yoonia sp. SDW83-1]|uniref:GGDEF domain-containing protein n=1 Tax=Yoonia sp. SDW83-1 TaxID=3366945 RepID=UPI00398C5D01
MGDGDISATCDATSKEQLFIPIGLVADLWSARSRDEILQSFSKWVSVAIKADRCSIALPDGDNLVVKALNGDQAIPQGTAVPINGSVLGRVFANRTAEVVRDLAEQPFMDCRKLADAGMKCLIDVPLLAGDRCFGTLAVALRQDKDDLCKETAILTALAQCIATQLLVIEQMDHLVAMARTDALTGAGNRHALYERAAQVWQDWQQNSRPFSFLAMDVDHFKQINDTYGHDIGDTILCAFVRRVAARSRAGDQIIRTGGEEFGLLMHDTDLATATSRANRLCDAIGDSPFAIKGMELNITASFGLTQVLSSDAGFEDVMKRADMALYEAKAAGRDQVISLDQAELAA